MSRNYAREYALYQGTSEQKKNRAERNAARAEAKKRGLVRKGDGKDVDHIVPLSHGGSNTSSNTRVVSKHDNRSFPRNSRGGLKRNV